MIQPNRLKYLRERSRLTQEEVGRLVDMDPTYVSKHENMERPLTDEAVRKYARLYKVETHEIFIKLDSEGDVVVG